MSVDIDSGMQEMHKLKSESRCVHVELFTYDTFNQFIFSHSTYLVKVRSIPVGKPF